MAAVTDTDLYRNVRQMLRTALLPTLLTLGLYVALSLRHPLSQLDQGVLSALESGFTISWTALLPAAVMFLLPLCRAPIKWAMAASIAVAAGTGGSGPGLHPLAGAGHGLGGLPPGGTRP